MRGIHLDKPYDVKLIEKDMPVPKEGEALIKVKSAGICGSDIAAFRGSNPLVSYPRMLGHEIAGEVISIPANPSGIKPGDKVVVDPYLYCGQCYPCSQNRTNCCEQLQVLGVHVDGGMVDYLCHPANMLVKIPNELPWDIACMAEPLTIALHGLHRAHVQAGEHVAIIGAGTIGMLTAQAALYYGAIPILIDIVQGRLDKAQSMGMPHTINPQQEDVERAIVALTKGRRCEAVIEASGANASVRLTLDVASHAGRVVFTGWPKQETSLPTDMITRKELDVFGSRTSVGEFEEAIQLISRGDVDVRLLLTELVSMEQAAAAIEQIERNPANYLKVNVLL